MIGKRMFSMFDKELGPLQQEQIRLGRENGLSDAQVALYATSMYNFAQMREIRLALEHNADPRQLRSMLKSWLPAASRQGCVIFVPRIFRKRCVPINLQSIMRIC